MFARKSHLLDPKAKGIFLPYISINFSNRQYVHYYGFHGVFLLCSSPSPSSPPLWSFACPDGDLMVHGVGPSLPIHLNFLAGETRMLGGEILYMGTLSQ